jgi:hypothetical protein
MKTCKTLIAVAICLAVAGVASAADFSATIEITGNVSIVLGDTTTLTATWSTNKSITRYEWLVDGVSQGVVNIDASSGTSTFDFTPTAVGDYEIGFHIWHHVHYADVPNPWDAWDSITVTVTDPQGDWRTETAFGGDSVGDGAAWWYYFDTSGDETQDIWAGQDEDAGDVTVADIGGGYMTITIDLGAGWELQDVPEPVKIQGFNDGDLPTERLPAGLFTTYKGSLLEVTVPAYDYFVIQLDVRILEADAG